MPQYIRPLTYFLFLLSGATGLIYEVAWSRDFSLIFGASHEAISIVLASFMTGLALGGIYFGRRSRTTRRPLRLYGILELGIGAAALLVPVALTVVEKVYVGLAARIGEVNWYLNLLRIAMAFTVLVIPTFFMGGTLPLLSRFLVRRYGEFGVRLSWLYGTNTLGAVLGVASSGFILLPALGVWKTQLLAVALNLVIGLVAILADRAAHAGARAMLPAAPGANATTGLAGPAATTADGSDAATASPWAVRLTYFGTAIAGFCALALEVMWTRSLSVTTGLSVYSFTVMLSAFLLGISIGSWLHALLPLRRIHESAQFGIVFLTIALTSMIVTLCIPQLPQLALELGIRYFGGSGVTVGTSLILSLGVMLVPCIFMGVAFPLAGQARARMKEGFGEPVGNVFGLNTLGAILGSLLAGFVLIPLIGVQRGLLLVSAIYAGYGVLVLGASIGRRFLGRGSLAAVVPVAAVLAAGAVFVLPGEWDRRVMGGFSHNCPGLYVGADRRVDVQGALSNVKVLYYREGRSSTVSVYELGGQRVYQVNGHTEAGDALLDLHHEVLLGHVPALLHPNPKSAVVIGLGAGGSLGALSTHKSIEKLTVVEIEPAVVGVGEEFGDINEYVLRNPRLKVVFQDGRNYMLTTKEKFDVISADPLHPWTRGAAYLYTAEYYAMLANHLTSDGIVCQWLGLYELTPENIKSIVRTFADNFKHTNLWQIADDIIIVGSNSPMVIDLESLARRIEEPAVTRQLRLLGLDHPLSFLAEMALDDEAVRRLAAGAIINTDDNLYIEFSSPFSTAQADVSITEHIGASQTIPAGMVKNFSPRFGPEDRKAEVLGAFRWAKKQTLQATLEATPTEPVMGRLREVIRRVPQYDRARVLASLFITKIAEGEIQERKYQQALQNCARALEVFPRDGRAHHLAGVALSRLGQLDRASERFQKAIELKSLRYWENYDPLGTALAGLGRHEEALRVLREAIEVRPKDDRLKAKLSWLLATCPEPKLRDGPQAVRLAEEAIATSDRPAAPYLDALAAGLAASGRFQEAIVRAKEAVSLAERQGEGTLASGIRERLDLYRLEKPFHGGARPVVAPGTVKGN